MCIFFKKKKKKKNNNNNPEPNTQGHTSPNSVSLGNFSHVWLKDKDVALWPFP